MGNLCGAAEPKARGVVLTGDQHGKLSAQFAAYDKDGSGSLTREELKEFVADVLAGEDILEYNPEYRDDDDPLGAMVDKVLEACDEDRDGQINIEEFKEMVHIVGSDGSHNDE